MISDFTKEKVFWTRKMNLKLVKFIQSRPNIWNPKHPKYTSVDHRDRTYAEFAAKYGNEFSGQAVKHRWTNIRSTFANYLRKINASQLKGEGEEYKVHWHLWDACQFLRKVNRKAGAAETSTDGYIDEEKDNKSEIIVTDKEWTSDEEQLLEINDSKESNCKNIADSLLEVFKNVQNDAFGIDSTKHGRIGRLVAKKLSQMNSFDAAVVSNKIMEVLLLYDENNCVNPNNNFKTESR